MSRYIGILGIFAILLIAYFLSNNKKVKEKLLEFSLQKISLKEGFI